jgi:hypothetical protein
LSRSGAAEPDHSQPSIDPGRTASAGRADVDFRASDAAPPRDSSRRRSEVKTAVISTSGPLATLRSLPLRQDFSPNLVCIVNAKPPQIPRQWRKSSSFGTLVTDENIERNALALNFFSSLLDGDASRLRFQTVLDGPNYQLGISLRHHSP